MPTEKTYRIYWERLDGVSGVFLVSAYDEDEAYMRAIEKLKKDKQKWDYMEAEEGLPKHSIIFQQPRIEI